MPAAGFLVGQHHQVVTASGSKGRNGPADLVYIDHIVDLVRGYGLPCLGVFDLPVAKKAGYLGRAAHIELLAVEGDEDYASGVILPEHFQAGEHLGERQERRDAGGIAVGAGIHHVPDCTHPVVVRTY